MLKQLRLWDYRYPSRWGSRCLCCGQRCRQWIDASGYFCVNCGGHYRSRLYDAITRVYQLFGIGDRGKRWKGDRP